MAKRMTADEWGEVRGRWESDPREGYTWIVSEMNLGVSDVAVLKRARKEGWAKKATLKTIVERAQARADEKVSRKVSGEVSPLTTSDAVDLRASVIEKHRDEWAEHRETFTMPMLTGEDSGLNMSRIAKMTAETIRIRQQGEREAWGLDAVAENTTTGVSSLSELEAMFELAKVKTQQMMEAVRKERGGSSGGNAAD